MERTGADPESQLFQVATFSSQGLECRCVKEHSNSPEGEVEFGNTGVRDDFMEQRHLPAQGYPLLQPYVLKRNSCI